MCGVGATKRAESGVGEATESQVTRSRLVSKVLEKYNMKMVCRLQYIMLIMLYSDAERTAEDSAGNLGDMGMQWQHQQENEVGCWGTWNTTPNLQLTSLGLGRQQQQALAPVQLRDLANMGRLIFLVQRVSCSACSLWTRLI